MGYAYFHQTNQLSGKLAHVYKNENFKYFKQGAVMSDYIDENEIKQLELSANGVNLLAASNAWKKRNYDKASPAGNFVKRKNRAGYVWIPFSHELCSCCINERGNIRTDRDLFRHCKSIQHISNLFKVKQCDLRSTINFFEGRPKPNNKLAFVDMTSIYKILTN
jgi:hypothetical protein